MRAGLVVALFAMTVTTVACNGDKPAKDSAPPDSSRDRAADAPRLDARRPDAPLRDLRLDGSTSMVLGVNGGTLQSADGSLALEVPAGALGGDTTLTVTLTSNVPSGAIGGVGYDIGPTGLVFSKPVTLRVGYIPALLMGADESKLRLGTVQGGAWTVVSGSSVNVNQHQVMGQSTHLSVYGVMLLPAPKCVDGGVAGDGGKVSTLPVKETWYAGGTSCGTAQLAVKPNGPVIDVQLLQIPVAQVPGTCTGHEAKVTVTGSTVLIEIVKTGGSACFTACWDFLVSVPLPAGDYVVQYLGFCQPVTVPTGG